MAKRGADSWYFIAADYAFGAALVKDTTEAIKADAASAGTGGAGSIRLIFRR